MKRNIILLLVILSGSVFTQNIKLEITKEYVLGADYNAKKEYLFTKPEIIKSDKYNNIYLVENKSLEIRKYDKNGKYIMSIGRAGEGPGEFKHIKSMLISDKDQLIVWDQILSRMTIFNLDGKYVDSQNTSPQMSELSKLCIYNTQTYVGLQLTGRGYGEPGNKIVLVDNKYKNIKTTFGHTSLFWSFQNPFEKKMEKGNMLNILTLYSGKVAVTKEVYDGKLYLFDNSNDWSMKIINGNANIPRIQYEIFDKILKNDDSNLKRACKATITSLKNGNSVQPYTFLIMSRSLGLFNYKDKYLINIIAFIENNSTTIGAELYNKDGSYIGFNKIGKNIIQYTDRYIEVLCMDNDSSLYISTVSSDSDKIPIISKYKINILNVGNTKPSG